MPKGFATARDAFAEIEARKNSGGGFGVFRFKLTKSGDQATVRILVDEPDWAWVHPVKKQSKAGSTYTQNIPCRDQDPETGQRSGEACPGCDQELQRKMAGVVPLIWRDAPEYETDSEGKVNFDKVVGSKDQVARWEVGKMILEDLDGANATFKGLTSRDFTVKRNGTGLDTTYDIKPAVDDEGNTSKTPMSEADIALAAEAPDLTNYFKPPSYEEWNKDKPKQGESAPVPADVSPFQRARA